MDLLSPYREDIAATLERSLTTRNLIRNAHERAHGLMRVLSGKSPCTIELPGPPIVEVQPPRLMTKRGTPAGNLRSPRAELVTFGPSGQQPVINNNKWAFTVA